MIVLVLFNRSQERAMPTFEGARGTRSHVACDRFRSPRRLRRSPEGRSAATVPCFDKKNSLFSERTGNWLQAIELARRATLKTIQRGRNPAKFGGNSLLISLFSGKSVLTTGLTASEQRESPSSPTPSRRHRCPFLPNCVMWRKYSRQVNGDERNTPYNPRPEPMRRASLLAWVAHTGL
jgi:hypothetical protein